MKKKKKMNIEYRITNNEFRNLDYPEFQISNFKFQKCNQLQIY